MSQIIALLECTILRLYHAWFDCIFVHTMHEIWTRKSKKPHCASEHMIKINIILIKPGHKHGYINSKITFPLLVYKWSCDMPHFYCWSSTVTNVCQLSFIRWFLLDTFIKVQFWNSCIYRSVHTSSYVIVRYSWLWIWWCKFMWHCCFLQWNG